jgi:hypothetical protein
MARGRRYRRLRREKNADNTNIDNLLTTPSQEKSPGLMRAIDG